jgi:hypothetical protein
MGNLSVWNLVPNELVVGYKFFKLQGKSDYLGGIFREKKDGRHLFLSGKNIFLNHNTKQISPPKNLKE